MPAPVVAETAWLMESRLGPVAETRFLRLVTSGELDVIDLTMAGYQRCIELIETYADMGSAWSMLRSWPLANASA